jgi:lipoprotein
MKKITLMKNLATAAIFALAISSTVSCDPEEKKDGNTDNTVYTLELKYSTHSSINIPSEDASERKIDLNTNLSKDQIKVTEKDGKDWCLASVIEEEETVKILLEPIDDLYDQDLNATFIVEAVGVEGVKPIEFTVSRAKYIYLELDPEFDFNYFAKSEGETLTITVNTNADRWYFVDAFEGDKSWYSINPTEGTDGTVVTIEFYKNTTSGEYGNIGQFQFGVNRTIDENGEPLEEPYFDALQFFTVMQALYVENENTATSVTVSDMMSGEIANGGNIEVDAEPMMGYGAYLNINADGGYEVKFFEHGTDTEITWVKLTPMGDTNALMVEDNTTGKERVADMAIFGAPAAALFRCTVTQAAE